MSQLVWEKSLSYIVYIMAAHGIASQRARGQSSHSIVVIYKEYFGLNTRRINIGHNKFLLVGLL